MAVPGDEVRTQETGDSGIPWDEILSEWKEREFTSLRRAVQSMPGTPCETVDALLGGKERDKQGATKELDAAFAAARDNGDDRVLLALYVHGSCLEKWEDSENYERINTVLDALEAAATKLQSTRPDDRQTELVGIVARQAKAIRHAMDVEDAMSCSCAVAVGIRAKEVVSTLKGRLADPAVHGEGASSVIRYDAETTKVYFDAVAKVADCVLAYLKTGARVEIPGVDGLLDELEAVGRTIKGDVYESELRAHRASLQAFSKNIGQPRIQVEEAEIVYLYPFTLELLHRRQGGKRVGEEERPDVEGNRRKEPTHNDVIEWALDTNVADALKKSWPTATSERLKLNDIWEGEGVGTSSYGGTVISLPAVTVETTAYSLRGLGKPKIEFTCSVRLSRLGNHYLRASALVDHRDGLHEVNQALRRGSHAMGTERIESGAEEWDTFPEYADDIIGAIAEALGEAKDAQKHGVKLKKVVHPNAIFHVVLAARAISIQLPNGRTVPAPSPYELASVVGASLLFNPVRHLATALEEWIRYPRPEVINLLAERGYERDFVVRTHNTTVMHMPASPEWLIDEYEEMIDFVASLPPLFALWDQQADTLGVKLDESLHDAPSISRLHKLELEILERDREIRDQLRLLRSHELCKTTAHRGFLDAVWDAAGLPALEAEVERRLAALGERQARITAMVRQREQERHAEEQEQHEKVSRRIETVLVILAGASIAGILTWGHESFHVEHRVWAWGELAVLIGSFIILILVVWPGSREKR